MTRENIGKQLTIQWDAIDIGYLISLPTRAFKNLKIILIVNMASTVAKVALMRLEHKHINKQ